MNRIAIFPLLALVTLAAPRSASATASDGVEAPTPDSFDLEVPQAFRDAADQTQGLSGYALRDALDEIAVSAEFWSGFRSIMFTLAESPHAQRQIDEFMRSEVRRQVAPPGVPPHVMLRAMTAAAAAAELLPSDLQLMSAAMEQAASNFDAVIQSIETRLHDRMVPIAIRRMERRAVRGLAAAMLLGAIEDTAEPKQCTELLGLYAEGMENAVRLIALGLEGEDAVRADAIIRDLRLDPLDRAALRWRAEQLAAAQSTLASTTADLDGEELRLPPDPGFRPTDS